ncbi:Uncharacterized protein APZ42_000866, partial [Daphnia magna]
KYIIFLFSPIGPERTNTAGRNSALATQHPILVYSSYEEPKGWPSVATLQVFQTSETSRARPALITF